MKKKLTILDIANLSGVEKLQFSRFFNNGYVSQEQGKKFKKLLKKIAMLLMFSQEE